MNAPISLNGPVMPPDFPAEHFEVIQRRLSSFASANHEVHAHAASAWNAVCYRYQSLVDYGDAFTNSIATHGAAPTASKRYEQERNLFGFVCNGFSVFEAFFYGMFAVGALLHPSTFSLATPKEQRRVNPTRTANSYAEAFAHDPINASFSSVLNDDAFREWQEVRNILTHRSAPGRTVHVTFPGADAPTHEWKISNIPLDINTTRDRRKHVWPAPFEVVLPEV